MRYKIKISFYVIIAATVFTISCRSPKSLIKKIYCYSFQKQQGTIKQSEFDDGLLKADTLFVVYAEVVTDKLQWDTAIMNGTLYRITSQVIPSGSFEAGFDGSGQPVIIQVKNNRFLVQLQFEPVKGKLSSEFIQSDERVLRFRYNNKTFSSKLEAPLFLNQLPPV